VRVYYDPSFLIALYLTEPLSPRARAFVQQQGQPILLNDLQELEFRNGLRQKVVRRELSEADLARCLAVFQQDWVGGNLLRKEVAWGAVFAKAGNLSARLGARQVCRSFDLLHVAISAVSTVRQFATLDNEQAKLARAAGLRPVELPQT
jgi:predicted nucleic acid-binding protein